MTIAAAAVVVASSASGAGARTYFDADAVYRVPVGDAPARGSAEALVTIVEFSDFHCRFCIKAQQILDDLDRLYPGKLRFVYRHNPLDPEDGTLAAEASLAAAEQGRFWDMHDRLYANPAQLSRAALDGYARELGLDMVRFRSALDERRLRAAVLADAEVARRLGARSTPMFFINGRAVKGSQPLSVFAGIVEQELVRADKMRARGVPPGQLYRSLTARGLPRADSRPGADPVYDVARVSPGVVYRVLPALAGHSRGPDDALVTIVELSDFECGYCARIAPRLRELEDRFGSMVRVEYRHLPLRFHRNAQLAAEAAVEAAAQGKFWPFHDRLFTAGGRFPRPVLERHAAAVGLDMVRFRAALDDRRHRNLVATRAAAMRALGVTGTPTVFVNGTPVVGAVPVQELIRVVLERKAEAEALLESGVPRDRLREAILADADVVERPVE